MMKAEEDRKKLVSPSLKNASLLASFVRISSVNTTRRYILWKIYTQQQQAASNNRED